MTVEPAARENIATKPDISERISRAVVPASCNVAAALLVALSYNSYQEGDAPSTVVGGLAALSFAAVGNVWYKIDR